MKIVVKYFYTICQQEQRKETIRQMIAEYFDDNIEFDKEIFKDYQEFLQFIFPFRPKSLNKLGETKNTKMCNILISELIETQQIMDTMLFELRKDLSQSDILNMYKEIDSTSDGFIDVIKLKKYLSQQFNYQTSNDDLIYIFRRMDKDEDGFISMAEFIDEFTSENQQISQMSTMAQTRWQSQASSQTQFVPPYSDDCRELAIFINKLQNIKVIDEEELLKLKRQFIKQKKQSFLNLFEDIAHSIYLDKRDLLNLLSYFKVGVNSDLERICKLFNKDNPNEIDFQDFLKFFTF
ncbi:unnamed protein product (macronuclear) [Paramecium tetraurelia]|uniref:EF-hand domain-containing protein n=1 Tax=Paramecium tetraurelia TaxID=5888 RepID=A0EBY7_PARTE|nr:uncharacterized protein GSPATT00025540001 [Paramecium tetraurelia]CAK92804.1 unnamed protein product [Paramecium tetraurelia]|eukprot:XP_001460201.1 hypothetical protein (macronuclear) [Paramecium tetraurelia strain d4-2]